MLTYILWPETRSSHFLKLVDKPRDDKPWTICFPAVKVMFVSPLMLPLPRYQMERLMYIVQLGDDSVDTKSKKGKAQKITLLGTYPWKIQFDIYHGRALCLPNSNSTNKVA